MLTLLVILSVISVLFQAATVATLLVIAYLLTRRDDPILNLPLFPGLANSLRYPINTNHNLPTPPVGEGNKLSSGGNYV